VLDPAHPDLVGDVATALDAYVFVAGAALIKTVIVGGETVVAEGQHKLHDTITARYRKTIARLTA
jgi:cytosine/adenosine deaminase-related metal-dependent hydrolase